MQFLNGTHPLLFACVQVHVYSYCVLLCRLPTLPAQVLGEVGEFNSAIQKVVRDVRFDSDVVVSVFETNIRVLG